MSLLLSLAINAVALLAAAYLVPGIHLSEGRLPRTSDEWMTLIIVALIFGVLNAIVKPILKILTFPLTILTLGLFLLVINAVMLLLTSAVASDIFHLAFRVDGFIPALIGSIVISLVSLVLSMFIKAE